MYEVVIPKSENLFSTFAEAYPQGVSLKDFKIVKDNCISWIPEDNREYHITITVYFEGDSDSPIFYLKFYNRSFSIFESMASSPRILVDAFNEEVEKTLSRKADIRRIWDEYLG